MARESGGGCSVIAYGEAQEAAWSVAVGFGLMLRGIDELAKGPDADGSEGSGQFVCKKVAKEGRKMTMVFMALEWRVSRWMERILGRQRQGQFSHGALLRYCLVRRGGIFKDARLMVGRICFLSVLSFFAPGKAEVTLPRSTPELQGVSSKALRDFVDALDEKIDTMHSIMVLKNGRVVTEAWWSPESAEKPHILWSLSKSFCSTAVGLAVAEGKLSLDDPVLNFFPDKVPENPGKHLAAMRVRHLLSMSGGHQVEPKFDLRAGPNVEGFLSHPVEHEPGTWFRYNTPGTYMLSAIVGEATGESLVDYLMPRLFHPLGVKEPRWEVSKEGHAMGGYGLYLCTEDIAKFGQLYLQKGQWQGKQLLTEKWVRSATSKQVENNRAPHAKNPDWSQGYGFQFWRCRHDCYRGDGRDGQICLVIPKHQVVIVMTAKTKQMQDQLNLVWQKLLPAFQADPLPEDEAAVKALQETVSGLKDK